MSKAPQRVLQESILRKRGLRRKGKGKLEPSKIEFREDGEGRNLTLAMQLIEAWFNEPIEDLIREGPILKVANRLHVDESTISKWRLRLGLRE